MADHERIWLQHTDDAADAEGRMWCCDKVWPLDPEDGEPTEYVRADLLAEAQAQIAAKDAALIKPAQEDMPARIELRRVDGVFEDHGPQVYSSTGRGYTKTEYVRADLLAEARAQIAAKDAALEEALEVLGNLHDGIAKHGNYSAESTMVFIDQAASAVREALAAPARET